MVECAGLTSTQHVVGAVAVEVVTLAVLPAVAFRRIQPLLALAGATDAVSVVAADVGTVVFPAVCVQILCVHVVLAALTHAADTSLVTPDREETRLRGGHTGEAAAPHAARLLTCRRHTQRSHSRCHTWGCAALRSQHTDSRR